MVYPWYEEKTKGEERKKEKEYRIVTVTNIAVKLSSHPEIHCLCHATRIPTHHSSPVDLFTLKNHDYVIENMWTL